MHPHLQRPEPLYMQLVNHYRETITAGHLAVGERLPTVREIADEWKVAYTTAAKALRQLGADGLVSTSNQGTFVTFSEHGTFSPADRLRAAIRGGRIYPHGVSTIVSAGLVETPAHVAKAMDLEPGTSVIRRERITKHGEVPVQWSISWLPGDLAESVPELLEIAPIPKGTIGLIKERTGRAPQVGLDSYRECASDATALAAERLSINEGDSVMLGENFWPEKDGTVLEFGEFVIVKDQWIIVK